jgi:predicted phage tail protein
MTEIILHGLVGKKFKNTHVFHNIKKPSDCIKAIDCNEVGFMDFFKKDAENNRHYEMIVDGEVVKNANDATETKEIKKIEIVPCIAGADPVSMAIAFVVTLVMGLIMAGIQYLLTPIPENEPQNAIAQIGARSFMFSNRVNHSKQYMPVPVGYGYLRVGSKIVESYIRAVDLNEKSAQRDIGINK